MAGPGLPTNIDSSYPDAADPSVQLHQAHHDAIHNIVNKVDTTIAATALYVPIGNGTSLVTRALLSTDIPSVVVNTQSGTTYTLAAVDAGALIRCTSGSAVTIQVPTNASVAFPVGTVIAITQMGAGIITVSAVTPATTTVASRGAVYRSAGQYAELSLRKDATDLWVLSGDIAT